MKHGTSLYLDMVRFSAAMIVFLEHFREITTHAFHDFWKLHPRWFNYSSPLSHAAVMVFFVLSGFVIAHVTATREKTALSYCASRFARLYSVVIPALILVAVTNHLEVLKYPFIFDRATVTHIGVPAPLYYLGTALFVGHFWLWPQLEPPNIPFWTMSFEVAYYVGIALVLFGSRRVCVLGLIALAVAAGPTIVLLAPTWLLGYCAYHISRRWQLPANAALVIWLASTLLVLLCPLIETSIDIRLRFLSIPNPTLGNLLACYAASICFTASVLGFAGIADYAEPLLRPISAQIRWLGSLTFSLYLFHAPIGAFINVYTPLDRSSFGEFLLMFGGTLFIVATLGRLCEQSKGVYRQLFLAMSRRVAPSAQ